MINIADTCEKLATSLVPDAKDRLDFSHDTLFLSPAGRILLGSYGSHVLYPDVSIISEFEALQWCEKNLTGKEKTKVLEKINNHSEN